ncbi:hypothetical protein EV182_004387 [Spiromyces aspiralis]|uniref:Uncharacterized protein n=1 Tax=Spiromyces aspiralis TaxID=68401 RepID=A0ACC1HDT6_9FUNG|nr:hypothetical protein EV182_004387 [Spiromyces aspiralis]
MCKRNGTFIDKESTYRSANLQKHQSFDLSSEVAVKFQMETNRKINESPDFEKFRASFTKDLLRSKQPS